MYLRLSHTFDLYNKFHPLLLLTPTPLYLSVSTVLQSSYCSPGHLQARTRRSHTLWWNLLSSVNRTVRQSCNRQFWCFWANLYRLLRCCLMRIDPLDGRPALRSPSCNLSRTVWSDMRWQVAYLNSFCSLLAVYCRFCNAIFFPLCSHAVSSLSLCGFSWV